MSQGSDLRVGGAQTVRAVKNLQRLQTDRLSELDFTYPEVGKIEFKELLNLRFDFEDRGLYRQNSSLDSRLFFDFFKNLLKTKESKDHSIRLTYLEGLKSWVANELEQLDPNHQRYEELKAVYKIFENEFKLSERWFALQRSFYE